MSALTTLERRGLFADLPAEDFDEWADACGFTDSLAEAVLMEVDALGLIWHDVVPGDALRSAVTAVLTPFER